MPMDGALSSRPRSPKPSQQSGRNAALGAAGGHRRGAAAAQQEPLSPEGTPRCSVVALQLDLGLGTGKPLSSGAACLDKRGSSLLKPLQQTPLGTAPALPCRYPSRGVAGGLWHPAKGAPALCRPQP